jgi:hypothetical protein
MSFSNILKIRLNHGMGDIGVIFAFILSERDALLRFKRISRKAMKDLIWKHQD